VVQSALERSPLRDRFFWRLPAGPPAVALTFDDGPDPEHTPELLEILARYDARATFFVIGEKAQRHPELLRQTAAAGHILGNHTLTHVHCPRQNPESFRKQLETTDAAIRAAGVDGRPPVFRPPFGEITLAQAWRVVQSGRRVAMWSADSYDYRAAAPDQIAALGERLQPRDILLMHDLYPATVEALPALLETLQRRGLRSVGL